MPHLGLDACQVNSDMDVTVMTERVIENMHNAHSQTDAFRAERLRASLAILNYSLFLSVR
jgi:hypothetical protein